MNCFSKCHFVQIIEGFYGALAGILSSHFRVKSLTNALCRFHKIFLRGHGVDLRVHTPSCIVAATMDRYKIRFQQVELDLIHHFLLLLVE